MNGGQIATASQQGEWVSGNMKVHATRYADGFGFGLDDVRPGMREQGACANSCIPAVLLTRVTSAMHAWVAGSQ